MQARVIVLAGPSGSGKSRLAERLGLPVLRLDDFYKDGDDPSLPLSPIGIPDWDDVASWNLEAAFDALEQLCTAGATVVPLNVLLKGREIAYHLDDSEAVAYFCFQGTPELPIGQEGHAGFEQADGCEHFFVITADPSAASPIEGTETFGQALAGQAPEELVGG